MAEEMDKTLNTELAVLDFAKQNHISLLTGKYILIRIQRAEIALVHFFGIVLRISCSCF